MAFLFSNLYLFLMLGYIIYIICRFSKPPPSIDDNKKKEVDVYKIQKIYMFTSICFVICAFFIINPLLTFHLYQYIRYLSIFFGIFNAVMTVLYIKYRDDIYFYESYNLIFTLLITFGAMSSDYKDAAYFMYERFTKRDSEESGHFSANKNVTYVHAPVRTVDPHYNPKPYEITVRGYTSADGVTSNEKGEFIEDRFYALSKSQRNKIVPINTNIAKIDQLGHGQDYTLNQQYDALRDSNERGQLMSRKQRFKIQEIPSYNSLHPKSGLNPQETNTFNSRHSRRNSVSGYLQNEKNIIVN